MNGLKPNVMIRGLDNSAIRPATSSDVQVTRPVTAGISSSGETPKKPVSKPKEAPKPTKPVKAPEIKIEPPESTKPPQEVVVEKRNPLIQEKRPTLKVLVIEFLKKQKSPVKPSEIWSSISKRYPEFKKTSFYLALRDKDKFEKTEVGQDTFYSLSKVNQ